MDKLKGYINENIKDKDNVKDKVNDKDKDYKGLALDALKLDALKKVSKEIKPKKYNLSFKEKDKDKDKQKEKDKQDKKQDKYELNKFIIHENGDIALNKWIKKQKDPVVVFLSEFIPNTKISKELQKFKPIIKTTPMISIEEYRKKKKIGEEGVKYLKKLKEKYGNIVLKALWANLNF